MKLRTFLALTVVTALPLACDEQTSDPESMSGPAGKADTAPPTGSEPSCNEGFELVDTSSDCLQDASCYELPDYGWCTGECPEGEALDEASPPSCVSTAPAECAEGFEAIDDSSGCIADADCYELPYGGWCTGLCPTGEMLDDSEPPQCVEGEFGGCLPGFELVESDTDCIADATCYEAPPAGWCTGECEAGEFVVTEAGPDCV